MTSCSDATHEVARREASLQSAPCWPLQRMAAGRLLTFSPAISITPGLPSGNPSTTSPLFMSCPARPPTNSGFMRRVAQKTSGRGWPLIHQRSMVNCSAESPKAFAIAASLNCPFSPPSISISLADPRISSPFMGESSLVAEICPHTTIPVWHHPVNREEERMRREILIPDLRQLSVLCQSSTRLGPQQRQSNGLLALPLENGR